MKTIKEEGRANAQSSSLLILLSQLLGLFAQELFVDIGIELVAITVANGYFNVFTITQCDSVLADFLYHLQVDDIRAMHTHECVARQALFHLLHAQ